MEADLILKIAEGKTTEKDAIEILNEICSDNHSSCNMNCPVYENYGGIPWTSNLSNCCCYGQGTKMLRYLRTGSFLTK